MVRRVLDLSVDERVTRATTDLPKQLAGATRKTAPDISVQGSPIRERWQSELQQVARRVDASDTNWSVAVADMISRRQINGFGNEANEDPHKQLVDVLRSFVSMFSASFAPELKAMGVSSTHQEFFCSIINEYETREALTERQFKTVKDILSILCEKTSSPSVRAVLFRVRNIEWAPKQRAASSVVPRTNNYIDVPCIEENRSARGIKLRFSDPAGGWSISIWTSLAAVQKVTTDGGSPVHRFPLWLWKKIVGSNPSLAELSN